MTNMVINKLIYASCMCSEKTYQKLFENEANKPGQQVQKYHRTLFNGFAKQENIELVALSKLPLNRSNFHGLYKCSSYENAQGIGIHYLPFLNIPIVGNLFQSLISFVKINCLLEKDTVVVIDVLNISMNLGIVKACKRKGIKIVGIITDLPEMLVGAENDLFIKQCNKIIEECDAYVLLTDAMNDIVNKDRKKPYVVIEGQVDSRMQDETQEFFEENNSKICMYTGSLNRIHGIEYLVKGFIAAEIDNAELHIYGDGDFANDLVEICKQNRNVIYGGVKLNSEIVQKQKKATLLINPRPTNQDFVKYSFPSKNMEYMVSGTPVLTTKLPGMPKEYEQYVFLIEEENADGMKIVLRKVLSVSNEELRAKGRMAKNFVLNNKSEKLQAKKIIDMIWKTQ